MPDAPRATPSTIAPNVAPDVTPDAAPNVAPTVAPNVAEVVDPVSHAAARVRPDLPDGDSDGTVPSPEPMNTDAIPSTPDEESSALPPEPNPRTTGRTVAGLFAPGNGIGQATRFRGGERLQHGVRAFSLTGTLPDDVRDWRDDVKRGLILDNGGLDALTAAQKVLVDAVADVATHRKLYARFIDREGLLTSRGRRRAAEDGHNAATDRLVRLLSLLGIGRKARPVEDLDGYLARRYGPTRPQDTREAQVDANHGADRERAPAGQGAATTGTPEPDRC